MLVNILKMLVYRILILHHHTKDIDMASSSNTVSLIGLFMMQSMRFRFIINICDYNYDCFKIWEA